ncbi:MAG TPA: hypothetical protein DEA78_08105 [Cyanobacteria bacterium UBA11159]|nr:hypothetical protein [Cyanobacteria bacterium UBA11159]
METITFIDESRKTYLPHFPSPLPRKGMETFLGLNEKVKSSKWAFQVRFPERGWKLQNKPKPKKEKKPTFQVRFPERGWKRLYLSSKSLLMVNLSKSASPKGDGNKG